MHMQETPPIIRMDIKHKKLIMFICFLVLTTFIMQGNKDGKVELSKIEPLQTSAGASKCLNEEPAEGAVTIEVYIENVDTYIATASEDEEKIIYKSIEDIEISRNMDLRKTLGISREDFCKLLANFKYDYDGFYERNAGLIWDLAQKYQVNEIFICGVFGIESYFGSSDKHIAAHNYGSIMTRDGKLVSYESDEEGIEANFKLFANHYLNPEGKYYKGVTLDSIGDTYCPPTPECPSWAGQVYACMKMFLEN